MSITLIGSIVHVHTCISNYVQSNRLQLNTPIVITFKHCTKDCEKHLGGITPSISYAFDGVILLLKSTIGPSSFCQGAPQKFAAFMNYCRILAFSKKQKNSFVHIAMTDATCPSGLEHLTQLLTNYHCIVSSRILCSA